MKQIIIAIGREFGSGGHIIASKVAEHYNIPLFSKEMMHKVAEDSNYSKEIIEKFDEKPMSLVFAPIPIGQSGISFEQGVALAQFNFLRKEANEDKKSFVALGRCADEILADNENLVRCFIGADFDNKLKRVMDREGLNKKEATTKMKKVDKIRKTYHNFYCENQWGDARSYDLCINTGKIGIDKAVDVLVKYIDAQLDL